MWVWSMIVTRRRGALQMLATIGAVLGAGCQSGASGPDLTIVNADSEERHVWIAVREFEEDITISAGGEAEFGDALTYPDETIEATVTVEIDGTRSEIDVILSETFDELLVTFEAPTAVELTRVSH